MMRHCPKVQVKTLQSIFTRKVIFLPEKLYFYPKSYIFTRKVIAHTCSDTVLLYFGTRLQTYRPGPLEYLNSN